jgi:hypothetical protein
MDSRYERSTPTSGCRIATRPPIQQLVAAGQSLSVNLPSTPWDLGSV